MSRYCRQKKHGANQLPSIVCSEKTKQYTYWAYAVVGGQYILCLRTKPFQLKSLYKILLSCRLHCNDQDPFTDAHKIDGNWGTTDLHLFLDLDMAIPSVNTTQVQIPTSCPPW